jgi:hypothetical protein
MDEQRGRHGKSGHQNLIKMASSRLLNEVLGDEYLTVTFVREQKLDIRATASIVGDRFGSMKILDTEQRMYADIACAATFDQYAKTLERGFEPDAEQLEIANRRREEGKMDVYRGLIRSIFGIMTYIIECEINPKSNLLRDGPRLTAYKLLKQKNPNFILILAVFEGTKVDNPGIFDEVWEFPRKGASVD